MIERSRRVRACAVALGAVLALTTACSFGPPEPDVAGEPPNLRDILFRTADFHGQWEQTGVRDQLPRTLADGSVVPGRDYGRGFWAQQWLGLKRMIEFARKGTA